MVVTSNRTVSILPKVSTTKHPSDLRPSRRRRRRWRCNGLAPLCSSIYIYSYIYHSYTLSLFPTLVSEPEHQQHHSLLDEDWCPVINCSCTGGDAYDTLCWQRRLDQVTRVTQLEDQWRQSLDSNHTQQHPQQQQLSIRRQLIPLYRTLGEFQLAVESARQVLQTHQDDTIRPTDLNVPISHSGDPNPSGPKHATVSTQTRLLVDMVGDLLALGQDAHAGRVLHKASLRLRQFHVQPPATITIPLATPATNSTFLWVDFWTHAAIWYERQGQLERALLCIRQALVALTHHIDHHTHTNDIGKDDEENRAVWIHQVAGELYQELGDWQAAKLAFESALRSSSSRHRSSATPQNRRVCGILWNNIANCELQLDRVAACVQSYAVAWRIGMELGEAVDGGAAELEGLTLWRVAFVRTAAAA